jgi:DegV family protein with EDD domain
MLRYGIVVDSGCDADVLENEASQNVGFEKVPLKIEVGATEFSDGAGFVPDDMITTLDTYHEKTSTASPSPGEWQDAFMKYDKVFALTITSALSGSHLSASIGKQMTLEKDNTKAVEVLDSLSTGPEMTLIVQKLSEYIAHGFDFADISQRIRAYMQRTKLLFVLESVDNLMNNGRVSKLEAALIRTLNIRLLGRASAKGQLDVFQKSRGKMKIFTAAVESMLSEGYCGGKVIISHCRNHEMADFIREKVIEKYHEAEVIIMKAKGLNSYYAEKGGVLIGFETGCAQRA